MSLIYYCHVHKLKNLFITHLGSHVCEWYIQPSHSPPKVKKLARDLQWEDSYAANCHSVLLSEELASTSLSGYNLTCCVA